jgi:hypothetical protein
MTFSKMKFCKSDLAWSYQWGNWFLIIVHYKRDTKRSVVLSYLYAQIFRRVWGRPLFASLPVLHLSLASSEARRKVTASQP